MGGHCTLEMNWHNRIKIWGRVLYCFLMSFGGCSDTILSPKETVEMLINGKSLVRYGDGEFGIYQGKPIHYQKWSPELKSAFEAIKREYETDAGESPYLLSVPKAFMVESGFQLLKKRVYVSCWSEARYLFKKNFRHNIPYGDAFLFEKRNKEIYSQIWESALCPQNVIFVHNSRQYAEQFAKTYEKNVSFLQCPVRDAFEAVDELERSVLEIVSKNEWNTNTVMLTISAGPGGKVLAYRMSKRGYWCIDAGHCWDDPLEGI